MSDLSDSLWSKKTRELVILYVYNYLFLQEFKLDEINISDNLFDLTELIEIAFEKKTDEEKKEILEDSNPTFQKVFKLLPKNLDDYKTKLSDLSDNWKFTGLVTKSILFTFCLEREILPVDKTNFDSTKINFKTLNLYLKVSAKYLELAQISAIHAILGKLSL